MIDWLSEKMVVVDDDLPTDAFEAPALVAKQVATPTKTGKNKVRASPSANIRNLFSFGRIATLKVTNCSKSNSKPTFTFSDVDKRDDEPVQEERETPASREDNRQQVLDTKKDASFSREIGCEDDVPGMTMSPSKNATRLQCRARKAESSAPSLTKISRRFTMKFPAVEVLLENEEEMQTDLDPIVAPSTCNATDETLMDTKPPPAPTQTFSVTLTPTILTGIIMKTSIVILGSFKPTTHLHPSGEEPPVGYVKLCTDGRTVTLADESSSESVPSLPFQFNDNGQEKSEETKDVKNFFVWPRTDQTNALRFNFHFYKRPETDDGTKTSFVKLEVGIRSNQQSYPLGIVTLDIRGPVNGQRDLEVKPMNMRLSSPRSIAFMHGRRKCKFVLANKSVLSVQLAVNDANTQEPGQNMDDLKQRKKATGSFRKIWNSFSFDTAITKDRRDMDHTSQASSVISSYNPPTTCVGVAESIICFWNFEKEAEMEHQDVCNSETTTDCSQTFANEDDTFVESITKVESQSETITKQSCRESVSFETNITDDAGILTVLFGDHENDEVHRMDEATVTSEQSDDNKACSAKKENFLKKYFGEEDVESLRPRTIDPSETASSQKHTVHDADEDVDNKLDGDNIVPGATLIDTVEVGVEEHMEKNSPCPIEEYSTETLQSSSGILAGNSLLEDPVEVDLEQHESIRAPPTLSESIHSECLILREKHNDEDMKSQVSRDAVEVGLDERKERRSSHLDRMEKSDDKFKGMKRIRSARKVLTGSLRKPIIKLRKDPRAEAVLPNNNIDSAGRNIVLENEGIRDDGERSHVLACNSSYAQVKTGVTQELEHPVDQPEELENPVDQPEADSNKWFSWNQLIGISSSDQNSSSEACDSSSESCSDYSMSATSTITGRRVSLSAKKILKLARRLNVEPERLLEYIASLDDGETVVTALTKKVL